MKMKNIVIIGTILVILYVFAGFSLVDFYFGGKGEIISAGQQINRLCNDAGSCPRQIDGWQTVRDGVLSKGVMLYYYPTIENPTTEAPGEGPQTFRMIYTMPLPDHWFEVQGGVGKQVTSGWQSR